MSKNWKTLAQDIHDHIVTLAGGVLPAGAATHDGQDELKALLPASLGKKAATASLSVVQADPTRNIVSHTKTMTGSAIALSATSVICQELYLLAVGAAGTTYFGDSVVASGHGVPLSTTIPFNLHGPIDLANVYAIGTGPDSVAYVYLYEV